MPIFANTTPTPSKPGVPYCVNHQMPVLEDDLADSGFLGDPVAIPYLVGLAAVIEFSASGPIVTQSSYVVLQMDLGDGQWIDLAGVVWNGVTGTATFLMTVGVAGSLILQQTRAVGSAPPANFANQCPLIGRFRFVGKGVSGGASSSSSSAAPSGSSGTPGQPQRVGVTIRYNLLAPR
jgi:hypothetical protein